MAAKKAKKARKRKIGAGCKMVNGKRGKVKRVRDKNGVMRTVCAGYKSTRKRKKKAS